MRDRVLKAGGGLRDFRAATLVAFLAIAPVAWAQPPMADVVVSAAEMRVLPNTLTLVGTVEPLRRSVIGSEIAGIVEAMPVRQGDLVATSTLIVKLNDDVLRWQLSEAEASTEAARAKLSQMEFNIQRIGRLKDLSQANDKEVFDAQTSRDIAKHEVDQKDARVERFRSDLAKTKITAPFAGYVVARKTEVGEWVDRGGAVVELVDLSSVLVRVDVPESAIPFVEMGAPCSVLIDALERTFEGKVGHIIRQADPQARTFPVEVIVENADRAIASGMFARATVISGPSAEAVSVPKDAIVEKEGVRYVGIIMPGERGTMGMLIPVITGADIGAWVAVTSGNIRVGQKVIIRGNEMGVFAGFPTKVRVVDASGTPVNPPAPSDSGDTHGHGN